MRQDPTLEEAWSDFARSLARRGRSGHTISIYRKSYDSFWSWAQNQGLPPDPSATNAHQINRWVDDMLSKPASRNGRIVYDLDADTGERTPRQVQANTARIRWQNLRPFFTWWAKEMDVDNPFDGADTPRLDDKPVPVIHLDDIRALLRACEGRDFEARRDTAMIRFLLDTGCRVGEMVAMSVDGWDRRQDLVTLTGKIGTRIVPISPSTGEAMARYVRLRHQHPQAGARALWLGARGPLAASGVAQMLNRRADQAGVPHLHPHMFRHSWAHLLKAAGASEGDLMALGGWSTSAMVHRYGRGADIAQAQETGRRIALGDRL
jgi:site-specific recombinase XerD